MKLAFLALVTTLGLGGAALAEPAGPYAEPPRPPGAPARPFAEPAQHRGEHGRPRVELRRFLLEQFDHDRDGRLESDERRRAIRTLRRAARRLAMEERRARGHDGRTRGMMRRYDRDGDGTVGPGEMPPDAARRLRRHDLNRDGWVDDRDQP
jgi:EF hand